MKRSFLVVIIILLIVINLFTLIRFYHLKALLPASKAYSFMQAGDESDERITLGLNFTTNILNSDLQLENILIKDSLGNTQSISEIFDEEQKYLLVCRFSDLHCESCVNYSIKMMNHWIDSIGPNNVLFLGNYKNNRIFNRVKPLYGIRDLRTFNTPAFDIPVEELGYPYYFLLDRNLQIVNVFIPDKATPKISNEYLKNIKTKF